MSSATAKDLEDFLCKWAEVFNDEKLCKVKEGSVAGNFAGKLLEWLGWKPRERLFEVHLHLQVGSTQTSVYPDIVLAPDSASATKPGEVYAVIELKRPGLAGFEATRLQARCYADHLRAPVYAVIDGECIRIWRRRLVHDDVTELEVKRNEFESRFNEVRKHLGRSELVELHTDLNRSADEVAEARKRVGKIDHTVASVRLRLEKSKVYATRTREEILDADAWWGPHTGSAPRLRLSIAGSFDDWIQKARNLVHSLCRIVVHAGDVTLAVDEPTRWREELSEVPLHLERHHAAEIEPRAEDRLDPQKADRDLGPPQTLAKDLHAALDAWATEAVQHEINSIIEGMGSASHWGRVDVRGKLGTPWAVDAAWLSSTLRANASDDAHARRRLGPRTIPYLVDAVLFPMAVAQVLGSLQPKAVPGFPRNLDYAHGGQTEEIGFAYAMAQIEDFACDAFLLVLCCSSLTPARVRPPQRIGAPPEPVRVEWHIGDRSEHGIVCCLSDDSRAILQGEGWTTFESHLTAAIRAQLVPHPPPVGAPCTPPPLMHSAKPSMSAGEATTA
jgi:hypothetical protein